MSGARVERRLAAILAADVAGYSRLTGADEAGTLGRLAGIAHAMQLVLPITATGAIETKAGVRLVDAEGKRVGMTASGWHHF